ncbi:MAG: glycosyltransferase family 4 protein [Marinilabiliaceae bacterium]|nr:glycosyltransferase family 4 protein [Marinilabiliaceae bacterium]
MILLVSAHFPPEPVTAATLCYDLASALSKKQKVKVITPKPSRPLGFNFEKDVIHSGKFEHHILKSNTCPKSTFIGRMRESYSFGIHAANYIYKNHATIKCVYVLAWPLLAQYLIVRATRKYSIPTVTHVMDIYPESLANKLPALKKLVFTFLLPVDKYILQNSSKVITISSNMRERLIKSRKLMCENVEIVHTWQNDELFFNYSQSRQLRQNNSLFTFMFLGCLSKSAALEIIILAFKISGLKDARLIIAGNGSEKEYLVSLTQNYPDLNIEFWNAPLHKVPEIQDQADVLILSLRKNTAHFAMPSKLPAYMFSKKPVIASVEENSATAKAIKKANCGWTVMPEDPDKLEKVLKDVVSIPRNELYKYGDNGFSFAEENFSKEKNLRRLVELINKTL